MKKTTKFMLIITLLASLLIAATPHQAPEKPVKLIFIHHSTGENWLTDGYGNLGKTLDKNNYFVSDTNYGWGPDGIGDRTDIPNWVEWFASEETPTYMDALFNETEQHASYTRTLTDPGGENEIIMFKSCFPNSALQGNISDPPTSDGWLTIGNSKYVYNTILKYFATRPDKLFIAITAPPLSDSTYADNARAFNNWLVNDWLADYEGTNVVVFNFYDVLTGPDGGNTLYYPSDDDHPSEEGSRIATEVFLPQLNAAYQRWQAGDASAPPVDSEPDTAEPAESQPKSSAAPSPSVPSGMIDDFEAESPAESSGWIPYWDEATPTTMACSTDSGMIHSGGASLKLDFNITPDAWGTCALFYDNPQNWQASEGISFYYHAEQPALVLDVDLYVKGADGEDESYVYSVETTQESVDGWAKIDIPWADFHRVEWEADAGAPFSKQNQISGMAFGFGTFEDAPNIGTIWVDEVGLIGVQTASALAPAESAPEAENAVPPSSAPAEEDDDDNGRGRPFSLPCAGGLVLPAGLAGIALKRKKKIR